MAHQPPRFLEGERAILGACLIDNSRLSLVLEAIGPEHFYHAGHAVVFAAIRELAQSNQPVDWVSLTEQLKRAGKLEAVGGPEFLTDLVDAIPSAANVGHYAQIVREKAQLRTALSVMGELTSRCYESDVNPNEIEEQFQAAAFALFEKSRCSVGFMSIKDVISSSLMQMEQQTDTGLSSGLKSLDRITGGFIPGNLVIVGGRPSMGKTAWGLGVLEAVSPVGLCSMFSMEMTPRQLAGRLIARKSGLNVQRLRQGSLETWEWSRAFDAGDKISKWPVLIDFSSRVTISQMRSRIRQAAIQAKQPMILVLVDFLTLMGAEGLSANASDHAKVGSLTKGLKQIAKDFNLVMICLAQLSRQVDARPFIKNNIHERKPRPSDFRESGSVEEDADILCGIYRAAAYSEGRDNPEYQNTGQILVLKNRDGMIGEVDVAWVGATASYWDLEVIHDDPTTDRYDRESMEGM